MLEVVESYSADALAGFRCVNGRYRLLASLGCGRYGQVHLAYDTTARELVALKEPLELSAFDRLDNFLAEIEKLIYVRESGRSLAVTRIRDFAFEVIEGCPIVYYTMDFALLGEFFSFLESCPLIDEDSVRYFFGQLTEAVAGLHSLGLAHLDLKLENVLLAADSSVLLCDLGNAAWFGEANNGGYAGSREYCAPEALGRLAGAPRLSPTPYLDLRRLDSFALGVILFVALFKSNPFMAAEPADPYYHLLASDSAAFWAIFTPIRRISASAQSVLEQLLLSSPIMRPITASLREGEWLNASPLNPNYKAALGASLKAYRQLFERNLLGEIRERAAAPKSVARPRGRFAADSVEVLRRFIRQNEEKIARMKKRFAVLRLKTECLSTNAFEV